MANMATLSEQPCEWHKVEIIISNIDAIRGGEIIVLVYLNDGFPKDHSKALKRYNFAPNNENHTLIIDVPNSLFAIKVHHDQMKLNKVRKNWTRILPADGLGFSAGAKIRFGPPSFDAAKIQHPVNSAVEINMLYP